MWNPELDTILFDTFYSTLEVANLELGIEKKPLATVKDDF